MTDPVLVTVLLAVLVAVALLTAGLRDLLAVTVLFGAYSLAMAVLWLVLLAPDVALTEAAVGAGVTTSLFLVALLRTGRPVGGRRFVRGVSPGAALAALGAFGVVALTIPALPAVGAADTPAFGHVAPTYLTESLPVFGVENAVTAVLVAYRGFDTFGEVTVVFVAALAVLVVFGREVL
jgi:multicomponent Na+:H+ antiporter subunit B